MGRGTSTDEPLQTTVGRFHTRVQPDPHAPIEVRLSEGDLDRFHGCFSFGFSDVIFNQVLPKLSEIMGVRLVAVWDDFDEKGFYGEAEVMVLDEANKLRELPDELYDWFYSIGAPTTSAPESLEVPAADDRTRAMMWTGRNCNGIDLNSWSTDYISTHFPDESF